MSPRILRWLLEFWRICGPPSLMVEKNVKKMIARVGPGVVVISKE